MIQGDRNLITPFAFCLSTVLLSNCAAMEEDELTNVSKSSNLVDDSSEFEAEASNADALEEGALQLRQEMLHEVVYTQVGVPLVPPGEAEPRMYLVKTPGDIRAECITYFPTIYYPEIYYQERYFPSGTSCPTGYTYRFNHNDSALCVQNCAPGYTYRADHNDVDLCVQNCSAGYAYQEDFNGEWELCLEVCAIGYSDRDGMCTTC